jgi:hypothetical protein
MFTWLSFLLCGSQLYFLSLVYSVFDLATLPPTNIHVLSTAYRSKGGKITLMPPSCHLATLPPCHIVLPDYEMLTLASMECMIHIYMEFTVVFDYDLLTCLNFYHRSIPYLTLPPCHL